MEKGMEQLIDCSIDVPNGHTSSECLVDKDWG